MQLYYDTVSKCLSVLQGTQPTRKKNHFFGLHGKRFTTHGPENTIFTVAHSSGNIML